MGEDKKTDKKRKRVVPKAPVQMIISREYVGTQTVTEALSRLSPRIFGRRLPRATPSTMRGCPLRMYAMEHENVRTDMEVLQYGRNKNGEQDL